MLIEYFKQYMKVTRGITDKSVGHYITGINSINAKCVSVEPELTSGGVAAYAQSLLAEVSTRKEEVYANSRD